MMPRLSGGQAVIGQLEREGVDVVFGIPGLHTLEIYDALIDSSLRHVTARHEGGAGFMADGYARATGRVGVLLVITGPGLTNAATPIAQAYSDSSPLLVISSHNETTRSDQGRGLLHELKDQRGMMSNVAADTRRPSQVADIPDAIADAFRSFEAERPRPIHIEVPTDVLEREERVALREHDRGDRPRNGDEARIEEAADRLATADAPILLVGGGARGAARTIRRMVDRTGMPAVSTVAGKGILPADHDLNLGATLRREPTANFVSSRDTLLAVGTELSPLDTGSLDLPENLIHIDIDYEVIGRNYPAALGIVADAEPALGMLLEQLKAREVEFGKDHRDAAAEVKDNLELAPGETDDRHRVLDLLREAIPEDAVVVNDMTKLCYEARQEFPVSEPGTFHFPQGFGTLGFSPPAAYGAAIGLEDRPVVSLVGDGGFMFTVQELSTAVKYDLAVPIVVLNDDAYGMIQDLQHRNYDGRTIGTDIENPDFADMARTFGAAGRRIESGHIEEDLGPALEEAFARTGPTVIDLAVDF